MYGYSIYQQFNENKHMNLEVIIELNFLSCVTDTVQVIEVEFIPLLGIKRSLRPINILVQAFLHKFGETCT